MRGEAVGFMGVLRGIRSRGTFILRRGGMGIGSLGSIWIIVVCLTSIISSLLLIYILTSIAQHSTSHT